MNTQDLKICLQQASDSTDFYELKCAVVNFFNLCVLESEVVDLSKPIYFKKRISLEKIYRNCEKMKKDDDGYYIDSYYTNSYIDIDPSSRFIKHRGYDHIISDWRDKGYLTNNKGE